MNTPFYFGCWGRVGHYLWAPGMVYVGYCGHRPFTLQDLDGRLQPPRPRNRTFDNDVDQPQGLARLTHRDGWTVLSFWDRSVDDRGCSHSTFVLPGIRAFDAAVIAAREAFPEVWARINFKVYLGVAP